MQSVHLYLGCLAYGFPCFRDKPSLHQSGQRAYDRLAVEAAEFHQRGDRWERPPIVPASTFGHAQQHKLLRRTDARHLGGPQKRCEAHAAPLRHWATCAAVVPT